MLQGVGKTATHKTLSKRGFLALRNPPFEKYGDRNPPKSIKIINSLTLLG
jgi:hypothetical protein